jgi:hypothetical protein
LPSPLGIGRFSELILSFFLLICFLVDGIKKPLGFSKLEFLLYKVYVSFRVFGKETSVLKAAADLADQEGFEQVSLDSLAKKLQIRTPSLYNYVQGLPGLKKELACYAIRKLKEELAEAAIGKSGDEALCIPLELPMFHLFGDIPDFTKQPWELPILWT